MWVLRTLRSGTLPCCFRLMPRCWGVECEGAKGFNALPSASLGPRPNTGTGLTIATPPKRTSTRTAVTRTAMLSRSPRSSTPRAPDCRSTRSTVRQASSFPPPRIARGPRLRASEAARRTPAPLAPALPWRGKGGRTSVLTLPPPVGRTTCGSWRGVPTLAPTGHIARCWLWTGRDLLLTVHSMRACLSCPELLRGPPKASLQPCGVF